MPTTTIEAEPAPLDIDLAHAALVIIDMQRDFLEPGGFGAALGNDVSRLKVAVEPCRDVLAAFRRRGVPVIHTREGHRPDLSDAPPHKVERGDPSMRIGAPGPMGRILVRGEPGHDIIPELYPISGEPVIDKPGKGAFCQTDLDLVLRTHLKGWNGMFLMEPHVVGELPQKLAVPAGRVKVRVESLEPSITLPDQSKEAWDTAMEAVNQLEDYDFDAVGRQRDYDLQHARDHMP